MKPEHAQRIAQLQRLHDMHAAYTAGAMDMREACVKAVLRSYDYDEPIVREVRALPIPEGRWACQAKALEEP